MQEGWRAFGDAASFERHSHMIEHWILSMKKVEPSKPKEYEKEDVLRNTYDKKRAFQAGLMGETGLIESPRKRLKRSAEI